MTSLLRSALIVIAACAASWPVSAQQRGNPFVRIPAGTHTPFYGDGTAARVATFELQRDLVSVEDFARFTAADPRWSRGQVARVHADPGYLGDWREARPAGDAAVVNVSWFAARAYCASLGGRLPTMIEWEYVAAASADLRDATQDVATRDLLLRRYTQPAGGPRTLTGAGTPNWYGIRGMHGAVREWVLDFNSVMTTDDNRSAAITDRGLYCAAAAAGTRDPSDYAAYLRFALRASLGPRSSLPNLGFRCAR